MYHITEGYGLLLLLFILFIVALVKTIIAISAFLTESQENNYLTLFFIWFFALAYALILKVTGYLDYIFESLF
jgi:hypothetical protein